MLVVYERGIHVMNHSSGQSIRVLTLNVSQLFRIMLFVESA